MQALVQFILLVGLVLSASSTNQKKLSESEHRPAENPETNEQGAVPNLSGKEEILEAANTNQRSIAGNYDYIEDDGHVAFKKRAKPLKNIFMSIYKNYKSTYLGNRTSVDYKKTLRDRISTVWNHAQKTADLEVENEENDEVEVNDDDDDADNIVQEVPVEEHSLLNGMDKTVTVESQEVVTEPVVSVETDIEDVLTDATLLELEKVELAQKRLKRKQLKSRKRTKVNSPAEADDPLPYAGDQEYRYNVGPSLNMSLDMENDIVQVKLDGDSLRDLFNTRWLNDNTEQGRGKKYDMVSKVIPFFILPFLIQSAIIPFLVTKLKLLLIKSMLVGKLAIFLLILSAFKNSNKMMQTYEVAPSYWAGEPSRRSELAAAASSAAYSGYRVEGKPAAWIN